MEVMGFADRVFHDIASSRCVVTCRHYHNTSRPLSIAERLPVGAWDSHMHVIVPTRFPLSTAALYKPPTHTLSDAVAFEESLGIWNMVLVQPSIYGTDNSCLLDALKRLTPNHGRGVIVIDPSKTSSSQMKEWHELGVRGVRINLQSVGRRLSKDAMQQQLQKYADLLRPFNWAIQLYVPMDMISLLDDIVPHLHIKVCIDHFGSPTPKDDTLSSTPSPTFDNGFSSLLNLLRQGNTWVKISAPYRVSKDPNFQDLEYMFHELAAAAPDRLIYASDWPHTRFSGIDAKPFADACLRWAEKHNIVNSLFRDSAKALWDVADD